MLPSVAVIVCLHYTLYKLAVDMSCSGANLFDPVTGQEVVFVRSCTDGSISILPSANMQSVAVLPSDAAPVGEDAAINQTLFEIPHDSVAEAVDLTVAPKNPAAKKNDSLPSHLSWTQLDKQNAFLCKLVLYDGGMFLFNLVFYHVHSVISC